MSARPVTPAEAQEMLGDETEWRWEDSLCPGDSVVAAVYDDESEDNIALICGPLPSIEFAQRRATLIVSAPDLAATVASEPGRIAAAVAAERAAIVAELRAMAAQRRERALASREREVSDLASAEGSGLEDAAESVAARGTP